MGRGGWADMKLTFARINRLCDGWPMRDIEMMAKLAEYVGYDAAYTEGKKLADHYVGYHRIREDYPECKTPEAYDIVLDRLIDACERGDEIYQARRKEDAELEKQGLFTMARASELACFKDSLASCTPERCHAWRMDDDRHGHCALVEQWRTPCVA